jgi:hypothetical protein
MADVKTADAKAQRITLVIHPAGFTATLPADSGTIIWTGGTPPTVSTSSVTVISFLYDGNGAIIGAL